MGYQSYVQDSKILKGEKGTMSFKEPLILENAEPEAECKLSIEVWDVDTATADDMLAIAEVSVPAGYGDNVGELVIDQLHFIKQKVRRYMGPCKCCCCRLSTG